MLVPRLAQCPSEGSYDWVISGAIRVVRAFGGVFAHFSSDMKWQSERTGSDNLRSRPE